MMASPSATEGPEAPSNRSSSRSSRRNRSKARNGTFILPSTGERVRRQITLRNPDGFDGLSSWSFPSPSRSALRHVYSPATTFRSAVDSTFESSKELRRWLGTPTAKSVLKCSLAYLLGSMGTFFPPLAKFLGHQDGKHMVATITVYFHPARSVGSMEEAALLGVASFVYSAFIGITSMALSVLFESQFNLIEVGHAIILILFVGGGLGYVGWTKVTQNTPLVNVACSLTSLAIITILTKEDAVHIGTFSISKIFQVLKMVILGVTSTTIVNLLVWPVSAKTELRETMIKTTNSYGDMLKMITGAFLGGSDADLHSAPFKKALNQYKTAITKLTKNLEEAKLEHYFLGTENEYLLEKSLVNCMERLAQSIGGLRSAATTKFTLLGSSIADEIFSDSIESSGISAASLHSQTLQSRLGILSAIEEASEEGSGGEDHQTPHNELNESPNGVESGTIDEMSFSTVRTPSDIFDRFILHLGPSMKSLAYTISEILKELPFRPGPDYSITINEHFASSLTDALKLYSNARSESLKALYRSKDLSNGRSISLEADFEEVAASCGYFSFSLEHFAEEMQTYLSILGDLKAELEKEDRRSWKWLRPWQRSRHASYSKSTDIEREALLPQSERGGNSPNRTPAISLEIDDNNWNTRYADHFLMQMLYRKLLQAGRFMKQDNVRFALKVGIGASIYGLFAFIPATRPYYRHWRGEWGLVSFMLVVSMTTGASNTTGWARFIGTTIGATAATIVWVICKGNPFALAFCGWLMSLPCFHLIVAQGRGPLGRFIMLTYNLSCLYAYSLSVKEGEDDDDEGGVTPIIGGIALHRVVAVFSGIIWGLIITRVIWPISARQRFRDSLSLLWLRMSLIWKRDPLSTLLEGESNNAYIDIREEFALQRFVRHLEGLRASAASEFELRGPFPYLPYGRIVEATTKILDAFHAMNVVIQKDLHASQGEAILLNFTTEERAQLCARISHLFQVIASSLKLEFPLNDALPNTVDSRDRLLTRISLFRKNPIIGEDGSPVVRDEDYELIYAFILVTGQLAEEVHKVGLEIEDLFGVLDEDTLSLQ